MNWLKVLSSIPRLLGTFVPLIEALKGPGNGGSKQQAVIDLVKGTAAEIDGITGTDFLDVPAIDVAARAVIDAKKALVNAEAALRAVIQAHAATAPEGSTPPVG